MPMLTGNCMGYRQWKMEDFQNSLFANSLRRQKSLSAWIPGLSTLKIQGWVQPQTNCCHGNHKSSLPEKTMIWVREMTHFIQPNIDMRLELKPVTVLKYTQNFQLKWLLVVVAIAIDHVFTSSTKKVYVSVATYLTTGGAIWLRSIKWFYKCAYHAERLDLQLENRIHLPFLWIQL